MPTPKTPQMKEHKSGQAYVRIDHKKKTNIYLGPWGSAEARLNYAKFLENWIPGETKIKTRKEGQTVDELADEFTRKRIKGHYARENERSNEATNYKAALQPLRDLFGSTVATRFGPLDLTRVRDEMASRGQARTTANRNLGRVRFLFRWAVGQELYPPDRLTALEQVEGFRKGRSKAREPKRVEAVPIATVRDTLPKLSERVRAIVEIQLRTGARPTEICEIRPCEVDRSGSVWEYRPARHKSEHRDKDRVILIGPLAQAILRPWLDRTAPEDYCFCPADAPDASLKRGRKPQPGRPYTVTAYHRAIRHACRRVFPHPTISLTPGRKGHTAEQRAELKAWRKAHRWHPNQLRHTAATLIRAEFGLEAAQVVLGHAGANVTQVYAERDLAKARAVIEQIG